MLEGEEEWPYLGAFSSVPRHQAEEGERLRVAHINVRGLRREEKQRELAAAMLDHQIDIFILVDTRLRGRQARTFARAIGAWTAGRGGYDVLQAESENEGDGVAVLISRRWARHAQAWETYRGRAVRVPMAFRGRSLTIMAIYAPPRQGSMSAEETEEMAAWVTSRAREDSQRSGRDEVLLIGDFNACPNPSRDRISSREGSYRERRERPESPLLETLAAEEMVDLWRHRFPDAEAFTWVSPNLGGRRGDRVPRARLDQAWSTPTLSPLVTGVGIGEAGWPVSSDHAAILVEIQAAGILHTLPEVVPSTERGRKRLLPGSASTEQWKAFAEATAEIPGSVARSANALERSLVGEREVNHLCKKLESFLLSTALTHLPSRQEHFRPPRKAPRPYLSPGRRLVRTLHRRLVEARVRGEGELVLGEREERAVRACPLDAQALEEEGRTPDGRMVVTLATLRTFRKALKKMLEKEEAKERRAAISDSVRRRNDRFHEHIRETIQGVLGKRVPRRRIEVVRTENEDGSVSLEERGDVVRDTLEAFFTDWTKTRSPQLETMDDRWRAIYAPLNHVEEEWYSGLMAAVSPEELRATLADLPSKKAPGPTGIPNEIYKRMGKGCQQTLLALLNGIMQLGHLPRRWMRGTLVPIPKDQPWTGDLNRLRPIALLEAGRKILSSILTRRLGDIIHGRRVLTGGNYGFTPGQRTGDFVHVLRAVMDEASHNRQGLEVLLMDIKRAYDSVSWVSMARALQRCRIPERYISLLQGIYEGRSLTVLSAHGPSDPFHPATGLDQGEISSPLLWLIFYDPLLAALRQHGGGYPLGRRLAPGGPGQEEEVLALKRVEVGFGAFADDLTLIAPTTEKLQALADICTDFFALHDIEANAKKSIHVSRMRRHNKDWPTPTIHLGRPMEAMSGGEVTDKRDSTEAFRILGVYLTLEGTSKEPLRLAEEMVEAGAGMLRTKRISPKICAYIIDKVLIPAVVHRAIGNTFRPYQVERIEAKWNIALKHSLSLPKTFYTTLTYRSKTVQARRLMEAIDVGQISDLSRRLHLPGETGKATRISVLNTQDRMSAHDSILMFPLPPGEHKGHTAYLVERLAKLGLHIHLDPSNRLMRGPRAAPGKPIVPCVVPEVPEEGRRAMLQRGITHAGDLERWPEKMNDIIRGAGEGEEIPPWATEITEASQKVQDNIPLAVSMLGREGQDHLLLGQGHAEWGWGEAWYERDEQTNNGTVSLTIPRLTESTTRWTRWSKVRDVLGEGGEVEVWTDGSYDQRRQRGGYAGVVMTGRARGARLMGAYHGGGSSSTLVEALAVLHVIAATATPRGHVVIKTDSANCVAMMSALLQGNETELERGYKGPVGRIWCMISHLLSLSPGRTLTVEKVAAHTGIPGNEEADRRAKEACAARGRIEVPQWVADAWCVGARSFSLASTDDHLSPTAAIAQKAYRSREDDALHLSLTVHIRRNEGEGEEDEATSRGEGIPEEEARRLAETFLASPMWEKIAAIRRERQRDAILSHWLKTGTGTLPSAAVLVDHHQAEDPECPACGAEETNKHARQCQAWAQAREEGRRKMMSVARRWESEEGVAGLVELMTDWGMGEGNPPEERVAVYGGLPAGWSQTQEGVRVPRKAQEELLWTFHSGLRGTWRARCQSRRLLSARPRHRVAVDGSASDDRGVEPGGEDPGRRDDEQGDGRRRESGVRQNGQGGMNLV
jgi:exonuclease III/ribonuclease HI